MSLTLPYTTLGPGVINSQEIVSNFKALSDKFGTIDNDDIKTLANIAVSKLSASYEYVYATLSYKQPTAAIGMPAANTVLDMFPIYDDGKGVWLPVAYSWACNNVGAKTGTFTVQWGHYDTSGTWTTTVTTLSAIPVSNGGTVDVAYNTGSTSFDSTAMAYTGSSAKAFRMIVGTQDAIAMDTINSFLTVSILLKRQITA